MMPSKEPIMNRRQFLQASSSAVLAAELAAYADTPIPMAKLGVHGVARDGIPLQGEQRSLVHAELAIALVKT